MPAPRLRLPGRRSRGAWALHRGVGHVGQDEATASPQRARDFARAAQALGAPVLLVGVGAGTATVVALLVAMARADGRGACVVGPGATAHEENPPQGAGDVVVISSQAPPQAAATAALVWDAASREVASALAPGGTLVLDAELSQVQALGREMRARTFWYALDANHARILEHADAGGATAFVEDGTLFFLRGHLHEALISESRLPRAPTGDRSQGTRCALAAAALAACAGISNDAIAAGLERVPT